MRVEIADIGTDVGALVVDTDSETVVFIDPGLGLRDQVRLLSSLLTDEEFTELVPPFVTRPRMTAVR